MVASSLKQSLLEYGKASNRISVLIVGLIIFLLHQIYWMHFWIYLNSVLTVPQVCMLFGNTVHF